MESKDNRPGTPKLKLWMVAVFAIVVILFFFGDGNRRRDV